ncbi:Sec-independent protein translocase protein TatB [Gallaecimonas xiamenensis]|uniref:Sec-independent protein translocase protein TatB n=1 Tax=Gallaecimonas xiamenensis 3-C-1 TaxID=745411 RepID=K2JKK6_9GAMM|nr:Sec-independent protein translocase protein TatB [Gallaecimonas xiamenensis]EKE75858.1 twin-arginine translocation protein subunit TatB [Gallaecimonas xiamenensis 3-C-1]
MFDIGFWELVLVALIALIVLGPERMPGAARTLGRWVRTLKGMAHQVRTELERELEAHELNEAMKKADQLGMDKLPEDLAKTVDEMKRSAQELDRPFKDKDKHE